MGRTHTSEARTRISKGVARYHQLQRERARVMPRDLVKLRASGTVPLPLRPFLEAAEVEARELIEALGGAEVVSPQVKAIIEDVARVGLVLRGELARYVQAGDTDAGSRVGTLASARRASLLAVGLTRYEKKLDLQSYLRMREREKCDAAEAAPPARGDAIGDGLEAEVEEAGDRSASGDVRECEP